MTPWLRDLLLTINENEKFAGLALGSWSLIILPGGDDYRLTANDRGCLAPSEALTVRCGNIRAEACLGPWAGLSC